MKVTILLLALFATSLFLSGCATDPEDRNFFEHGWVQPGKHDFSMSH